MQKRYTRGFSLMELMIVVAIIAILAAVAVPSYRNHICKVERNQAKADLMAFAQAVERYYTTNNFSYVDASNNIPDTVFQKRWSPQDSTEANKRFNLAVDAESKSTYTLSATRIASSNCGDGPYTINSANVKTNWDN